jgi:hypothetical protein
MKKLLIALLLMSSVAPYFVSDANAVRFCGGSRRGHICR